MIVVGIDPGYASLGYAFLKVEQKEQGGQNGRKKFCLVDFGEIHTKASTPFVERLGILDADLRSLIRLYCGSGQGTSAGQRARQSEVAGQGTSAGQRARQGEVAGLENSAGVENSSGAGNSAGSGAGQKNSTGQDVFGVERGVKNSVGLENSAGSERGVSVGQEKNYAAVEKLLFARNTTSALKVSEARGVVLLSLYRADFVIQEYYPSEMKKWITGNGKAHKKSIMEMLPRLIFNLNKVPKEDNAADALAMALCCAFSLDLRQDVRKIEGGAVKNV